jgi:hypothetical protein
MEGSKIMGILDDVTHAGDQPEIVLPQEVAVKETVFLTMAEEDVVALKEWLNSAGDEDKHIEVDGNVTKTVYSHSRFLVKPIFVETRTKLAELFKTKNGSFPTVSKYYTIAYSNSEPFTYANSVFYSSEVVDDSDEQYKLFIVLEGSLKTSTVLDRTLSVNEAYCMLTNPFTENISNSGEEDSLVLCVTLS